MLQDEEEEQQYGVQDLRQLVAGERVHFQGSTLPQGNDPLLFVEGSRNNNILARPMPLPPPPLLLSAPSPHPPPHHSYHQYYDNLSNNINSILGGQNLQVGGGAGVGVVLMESTPPALPPPPPPPPPCHGRGHGHHYGWNININNVVSDLQRGDGNISNCRWPRQETLTLLEIRSRLDPKFKEANQKAPLWDQLSRIMGEEHGYYRSGKKCREKFENLYKYYKKTKEGKAGRQDGKHYRFFRQLEALYGETISTSLFPPQLKNTTTTNPTTDEDLDDDQEPALSTNFSNTNTNTTSQEFDHYPTTTSSSENNNNMYIKMNNNNDDQDLSAVACSMMMNMRSGKSLAAHDDHQVIKNSEKKINWKVEKVKGFVELEMRRLAEAQEAWMERMERMIGDKEKESMCREEEWTKQEVARLDRQHEAWAKERAWMEARDASFLDTFKKYTAAKFTHIAAGAGNNTTSCFHPDIINNNNLSCVGSSSRLAEAHEWQELWSSYELKKKEMIMRKENN